MDEKIKGYLDDIGLKILRELQTNARISFSEIGRRVGLSSPAVAERVYKMEDTGIIKGYHAQLNPDYFGHKISAFITISTQSEKYPKITALAQQQNEILECHHISGSESLILKVVSNSIPSLDRLVETLSRFGQTKTAIVLSTPVNKKTIESIR